MTQGRSPLTLREEQILALLREGYCQKEVAKQLFISPFTVKSEMRVILAKLDARNATHAVITAIRRRYLSLENE